MENIIALFQKKGIETLPDNKTHRFRFEIKSESSNRLYIIAQHKSNLTWGCSCPGWIRHRSCKHLTAISPLLEDVNRVLKLGK